MFYLFQPLPGSDFVNTIFTSGGSHNSNNTLLMHNVNSLVDIYIWDLYVQDETLIYIDDTFMCMDKTYVYGWYSWMDEIIVYDCIYNYVYMCDFLV
jgi:hypothetical protein